MKKLFMLAAIVVVASWVVIAQEQKPSPPSIDPARLLLEIDARTPPPGYSEVNAPGETSKWAWVSRFVRIPGRPAPPGKPISAIRFEPVFNGETVDVKVTLLRGSKGFEQEDLVGVYQLGIGEQKTVSELDQFGIEPFKIAITNSVPPLPPPPAFNNETQAIEVVSVQAENFPRPAYKITFRNVSDKSIRAVKIDTTTDGRRGEVVIFQGEDGRSFLQPGGVAERRLTVVRSVPSASSTGYTPGTPAVVTVNIRTVVFDDLSFEGAVESACSMESSVMSRRFWLTQVLAVLDRELSKSITDHAEAAKQFKEKVSALSADLDESDRDRVSSVAPGCPKPARSAITYTNGAKIDLLRELDRIISTPVNFKSWMEEKRARYSAWLARL